MALDTSEFDDDLIEALGDLPKYFTWQGNQYRCSASQIHDEPVLVLGGDKDVIRFRLVCRKADFTNGIPEQEDLIILDGTTYRIQATNSHPIAPSLKFDCIQEP